MYQSVVLRKNRDLPVLRGSPWVFSGAVLETPRDLAPGDVVRVFSASGDFVAMALFEAGSIALKVLSLGDSLIDERFFLSRIKRAAELRHLLGLGTSETNGYRLINSEGDALPGLVVDRFDSAAVIQFQSVGMYRCREVIAEAVTKVLPALDTVFLDSHCIQGGESSFYRGHEEKVTFREHGLTYLADIVSSQKTGFFFDQRVNRQHIKSTSKGKKVLNLFSFSGGFSLCALDGGATQVVSVDSSSRALSLHRQNLELNGFDQASCTIVEADCFGFLESCSEKFDLVIVDPPAFAKHRKAKPRALKGYERLFSLASQKVIQGGSLCAFSCSQVISDEDLETTLGRACIASGRDARVIHRFDQAPCHPYRITHPEGRYLKGFSLKMMELIDG